MILEAWSLFLPILAANQAGMVAKALKLPLRDTPVNRYWLGENKTAAPYYVGPALAFAVYLAAGIPQLYVEAFSLGLAAVAGDHIKSLIKRSRWVDKAPGEPWLPDRFDFALAGGLMAWAIIPWVTVLHIAIIVATALPVHYIGNQIGYNLGWRKTPH